LLHDHDSLLTRTKGEIILTSGVRKGKRPHKAAFYKHDLLIQTYLTITR